MKSTVILVSWNSREDLGPCLDSLAAQDLPRDRFEAIMVDNGSSDGSVEYVRENYPWVRVLVNSRNNYAGANNLGIKEAGGDYIALLNIDTRAEPNWLPELVRTLEDHPKAGVATGKIYRQAPGLFAVGMREKEGQDWEPIGDGEQDSGRYDGVYPVRFINHCGALYRRQCLDAVGGLDEDFMMYHEDVDMSIRVHRAGWKLMVNSHAVLHHTVHGSIGQSKHMFNYYIHRNRLYVIAKHYPGQFARYFPLSPFFRYQYRDDSNESFQADLSLLLEKWLTARGYGPGLPEELALIMRTVKERSHDRMDQMEIDLQLKSEGLVKAICQLELDYKDLRRELREFKEGGRQ